MLIRETIESLALVRKGSLDELRDALLDLYIEKAAKLATGEMTPKELRVHQVAVAANLGWDYEEYLDASNREIRAGEEEQQAYIQSRIDDEKEAMRLDQSDFIDI